MNEEVIVRAGTSGFSYRDWKPRFYPKELSPKKLLAHYASRLPMVEINNTFYKRPEKAHLEAWAAETPAAFRFVFKASRYFSAGPGIRDAAKPLAEFFALLSVVKEKLGPLLVQFPPHIKKDIALLQAFLAAIPSGKRVALDLRDPSWQSDDAKDAMRAAGVAWCVTESDEEPIDATRFVTTAPWGYFRLRKSRYDARALDAWALRLRDAKLDEAFVALKHDEDGANACHAATLQAKACVTSSSTTPRSVGRPRRP